MVQRAGTLPGRPNRGSSVESETDFVRSYGSVSERNFVIAIQARNGFLRRAESDKTFSREPFMISAKPT